MKYKILMKDRELKATACYSQQHQAMREFNRLKDALVNGFVEFYEDGKLLISHKTDDKIKWIGWLW